MNMNVSIHTAYCFLRQLGFHLKSSSLYFLLFAYGCALNLYAGFSTAWAFHNVVVFNERQHLQNLQWLLPYHHKLDGLGWMSFLDLKKHAKRPSGMIHLHIFLAHNKQHVVNNRHHNPTYSFGNKSNEIHLCLRQQLTSCKQDSSR